MTGLKYWQELNLYQLVVWINISDTYCCTNCFRPVADHRIQEVLDCETVERLIEQKLDFLMGTEEGQLWTSG